MNNDNLNAKELDKKYILQTYGRYDLEIDHGKGATLYSDQGKEYIDFSAGIGTLSLGTADEGYIKALNLQLQKVQHISNYFYSEQTGLVAEKIVKLSGLRRVFFGNSGAEANEGAIKVARKYSFDKYGENRSTIITLKNSFHGRTITTLAATGQESFHDFFFPFTEGFKYSPLNEANLLLNNITSDVCAIMCEPIQGEGGVNIMTQEFADVLKKVCAEKDILLILDEVQSGIARSGKMFAFMHYNLLPDIMTLAKGLGGGLPIGVFVCGEKTENVLTVGQHGTTFGGNPVVCAGANEVLNRVSSEHFLNSICEKGEYIRNSIKNFDNKNVIEVRGKGLMIGIEVLISNKEVTHKAFNMGLLTLTAGKNVVRLLPPLTITKEEIDKGLKILEVALKGNNNE